MVQFLKCPKVSLNKITEYLENSNKENKYSNFGYCENLLQKRLADILSVSIDSTCLGSSATSLLKASCELILQRGNYSGRVFFPVFSFFATFSIANFLRKDVNWFDLNKESFLPEINCDLLKDDLLYMNMPFGTSDVDVFFDYAAKLPCSVVIDAAACLPGMIYRKKDLSNIPHNVIIVFSLHATKLLSCGEGGFCIFGDKIPGHIKKLINFGLDENRNQKWPNSFNAKMSEFNAAAGLSSLDDLSENSRHILNAKKLILEISRKYDLKVFDDIFEPTLTINMKVKNIKHIIDILSSRGYESRRWWSLSAASKKNDQPKAYSFYNEFLGVAFDWEHIEEYFDDLCSIISKDIT